MKKRFLLGALISFLLIGMTGTAQPADACPSANPQAQTLANYGTPPNSVNLTAVGATVYITQPLDDPNHSAFTNHRIGIENETNAHLVQTGYEWAGGGGQIFSSFFYEFYPDGPPQYVDLPYSYHIGDAMYFQLWYHDVNSWGLAIQDLTTGQSFSEYIYDTGKALNYVSPTAILATEQQCPYDQLNDGTQTFKQPKYIASGTWHWFTASTQRQADLHDWDGDGHILETGGIVDPNQYTYHVWKRAS